MIQNFAKQHLQSMVSRIERLEADRTAIQDDLKEIYAEAKSHGLDAKTIRRVIRERKIEAAKRDEAQQVFDLYWEAVQS